jgi:hypothetical protein
MNPPPLVFRTVDLARDAQRCIAFSRDAQVCAFGHDHGFVAEHGADEAGSKPPWSEH